MGTQRTFLTPKVTSNTIVTKLNPDGLTELLKQRGLTYGAVCRAYGKDESWLGKRLKQYDGYVPSDLVEKVLMQIYCFTSEEIARITVPEPEPEPEAAPPIIHDVNAAPPLNLTQSVKLLGLNQVVERLDTLTATMVGIRQALQTMCQTIEKITEAAEEMRKTHVADCAEGAKQALEAKGL